MNNWTDMTTQEKNAWVAENVMGWVLETNGTRGIICWRIGNVDSYLRNNWSPITDRNDCAEAVRALELSGKQEDALNTKLNHLVGYADGPIIIYLLDPADICKAMWETLKEGDNAG